MRTLIVIPARGQSKGIPRKNLRWVGGRRLIEYTIDTAMQLRTASRRILSTDDEEVADVGRQCGIEVPFIRPPDLASDAAPTLPVVQHAVRWLEDCGDRFDAVCLLQPTHPLRRPEDVDGCIERLEATGADAVVTVIKVPYRHNPHWVYFQSPDGRLHVSTGAAEPIGRRQDLPPAFHRDGSVYVTRRDVVMNQNSLYGTHLIGVPVDPNGSVDIDMPEDLETFARLLSTAQGIR